MSTIRNKLITTYTADAAGIRAAMGQAVTGFRNMGQAAGQTNRQMGLLNQQFRAIGTTLRYAFAGAAVYGLTRMVGTLNQVQQQMGLIAAIGAANQTGTAAQGFLGQLPSLQEDIMRASVDSLTPIQDYNAAVINLLSTVQGLRREEITPMVTRLAEAARLTQTPIEDVTRAMTTMNVAFGQKNTIQNIQSMTDLFFNMIARAPGGIAAAPQIINQLGGLAAASRLANVNPAEMFGMTTGVLKFGIPPAQAGMGLRFLLNTIALPSMQVKESQAAFKQVGVSEEFIRERGGMEALRRIFGHAKQLGVKGDLGEALRRQRGMDPNAAVDEESIADLGLTGAGTRFLGAIFRRQHALRTAIALFTRFEAESTRQNKNVETDIKEMTRSAETARRGHGQLAEAWKRFADRAQLEKATIAIDAMQLQIAKVFEPVINFAAKKIVGAGTFMQEHRDLTKGVAIGTASLLGLLGLDRLTGGRVTGGLGKGIGRLFGQGAIVAKASEDAVKGLTNQTPGLSPQNPLYVIIVGQLVKSPGVGGPLGGTDAPVGGLGGKLRGFLRRFPVIPAGAQGTALLAAYLGSEEIMKGTGLKDSLTDKDPGAKGTEAWLHEHLRGRVGRLFGASKSRALAEQRAKAMNLTMQQFQNLQSLSKQDEKYPQLAGMAQARLRGQLGGPGQKFLEDLLKSLPGNVGISDFPGGIEAAEKRLQTGRKLQARRQVDVRGAVYRGQRVPFRELPLTEQQRRRLMGSIETLPFRPGEKRLELHNENLMKTLKENKQLRLDGDIVLTVDITDEGKKRQTVEIHIDPSTWTGGKSPTARGRPKVIKKTAPKRASKLSDIKVGPNPALGIP